MPPRVLRFFAFALVCSLAFAPSAWAADPPTARQTIVSADFNAGNGSFTLAEIGSDRPSAAFWGRTASMRRGTTGYGLWCAGTRQYPTVASSTFFPTYPKIGYLAKREREQVEPLTGTTARRLDFMTTSTYEVWSAASGGKRYAASDYKIATDAQGYTTIARSSTTSPIPHGSTVYVTYNFMTSGTRGQAILAAPQLADYYRSWASFYYNMPTLGTNDIFGFYWHDTGDPNNNDSHYSFPKTAAGAWSKVEYELSGGSAVRLSRDPGKLWFQFFDMTQGAGGVANGQGPTIDDFAITGYKYGPVPWSSVTLGAGDGTPVAIAEYKDVYTGVSSVKLTGSDSGQVQLSWAPPQTSVTNTAADTRPMSYRVWRKSGASAWTELTSSLDRVTTTSIQDALASGSYTYLVQAWDPGTGASYGERSQEKTLTRVGSDAPKPVSVIEYSIDGGALQTVSAGSHTISNLGPRKTPYSVRFRVRDDQNYWSPFKTIAFQVNANTGFTSVSGSQVRSYGKDGSLSGYLKAGSAPVGGVTVALQRSSNGKTGWTTIASKKNYSSGYVGFAIPASSSGYNYSKAYFRLAFSGAPGYNAASPSAVRSVDPRAYLGKPYTSTTKVKAKKTYTWRAKLKPRHTAGTKPVKLRFERKVKGKWRFYKNVYAKAYSSSTYSRVKASYKLPKTGKWRVRAYHNDAGHYPTYSSWLYVTAR